MHGSHTTKRALPLLHRTQTHITMKKTTIETLAKENPFTLIGKEWMLITAGTPEHFNMMTASWGGIGWLWNKPVAFIFVRPERHTYPILEDNEYLTLSFLGNDEKMRAIYNFCGSKSGSDYDKAKETGLEPISTEHGAVTFEQARLTIEARKMFRTEFKPEQFLDQEALTRWYNDRPGGSLHTMYVVEITDVYEK